MKNNSYFHLTLKRAQFIIPALSLEIRKGLRAKAMNIFVSMIFGAFVGALSSLFLVQKEERDSLMDIFLGVTGALVGAILLEVFQGRLRNLNMLNLLYAGFGAAVIISLGRLVRKLV